MSFQIRGRNDSTDRHRCDISSLTYYKHKLYSGANDGKILSWEEDLLTKVAEIKGHVSTVLGLQGSGNNIFSCSNDGTIKKWSLNDLKEEGALFKQEDGEIYHLIERNGLFYSSDDQGVVRIHQGDTIKNSYDLKVPLRGLLVHGNLLYTIREHDFVISEMRDDGKLLNVKTLDGRDPACIAGDYLCFASGDGKTLLVHENNPKTDFKQIASIKDAHWMAINCMIGLKVADGSTVLYTAGWDKAIKKWKIEKGTCKLLGSVDTELNFNVLTTGEKGEIYAGGTDGRIIRVDEM